MNVTNIEAERVSEKYRRKRRRKQKGDSVWERRGEKRESERR